MVPFQYNATAGGRVCTARSSMVCMLYKTCLSLQSTNFLSRMMQLLSGLSYLSRGTSRFSLLIDPARGSKTLAVVL